MENALLISGPRVEVTWNSLKTYIMDVDWLLMLICSFSLGRIGELYEKPMVMLCRWPPCALQNKKEAQIHYHDVDCQRYVDNLYLIYSYRLCARMSACKSLVTHYREYQIATKIRSGVSEIKGLCNLKHAEQSDFFFMLFARLVLILASREKLDVCLMSCQISRHARFRDTKTYYV